MSEKVSLDRHFPYTYLRILSYVITLNLYFFNCIDLLNAFTEDVLKDPVIAYYKKYYLRMLTIWVFLMQIIYSALGLICDIMSLVNQEKKSVLLKNLNSIRAPIFSIFVFPVSVLVSVCFWLLYTYDKELILPPQLLQVFPIKCNHIMHSYILPFVIWEAIFRPRKHLKSHFFNLMGLYSIAFIYITTLHVTYFESNYFPYPILNRIYGTVYFYVFFVLCFVSLYVSYKMQWYISGYLWKSRNEVVKKVK